jgi:hypothetical protein
LIANTLGGSAGTAAYEPLGSVATHEAKAAPHSGHATTTALAATNNALNSHTTNTANPHGTTAAQVGAEPSGAVSAHANQAAPHSGHATTTALATTNTALNTHTSNVSNPHGTTAAQVGALAVGNNLSDLQNPATARNNLGVGHSLLLDYSAAADLLNGATPANTWLDVISNQTFTVSSSSSLIHIMVGGVINFIPSTYANSVTRLVIDSGGSTLYKYLGGGIPASNEYFNLLSGVCTVVLSGLAAGTHTVKLQMFSTTSGNAYCRPATYPGYEFLHIRVVEHK